MLVTRRLSIADPAVCCQTLDAMMQTTMEMVTRVATETISQRQACGALRQPSLLGFCHCGTDAGRRTALMHVGLRCHTFLFFQLRSFSEWRVWSAVLCRLHECLCIPHPKPVHRCVTDDRTRMAACAYRARPWRLKRSRCSGPVILAQAS